MLTATLLDWAVRGLIEIRTADKGRMFHAATYDLVVKKPFTGTTEAEQYAARSLFGEDPEVGVSVNTSTFEKRAVVLSKNMESARKKAAKQSGFYENNAPAAKFFGRLAAWLYGIGVLLLSPPLLAAGVAATICAQKGKRLAT